MSDDPLVTDLVARAAAGDKQAWDALVERYAPLVWSICRRHRLSDADVADISRNVWLQLAGQLGGIRDPAAPPGWPADWLGGWQADRQAGWEADRLADWLAATTRRECGKVRPAVPGPRAAGQQAALREAFTRLPPRCQHLITLLLQDPPVPYPQISASLGIPVSSIGPGCGRCLDKLRHDPSIAALIDAGAA
jgi:DNA-directed RNA polymerase specialized sigma24 family protein